MKKQHFLIAAMGLVALGTSSGYPTDAQAGKVEKCYGIAKAGKNDCAAADGSHSCAGYAKVDGEWREWISLPEGVCSRIVGASLEPQNPEAKKE